MNAKENLRTQLESEVGVCLFSDLKAHFDRDAVVIVAYELALIDAGLAVAEDDAESVGYWISQGKFHKPSKSQLEAWKINPEGRFRSLIVRPYVLIQAIASESSGNPVDK